jgi:predicted deacetylase
VLILALLSLACRVSAQAAARPVVRRITVVFRYDDYYRRDARVGTELLALFQKYHIPCTYAVIPYVYSEFSTDPASLVPIDQETAQKLDDAVRSGLLEVAQHGLAHSNNAAVGRGNQNSEFSGIDYPSQLRMLSAGRGMLESLYHVSVTTFIPPWNKYDTNTLRALESLGFRVISASRVGITASGRFQRLRFLPFTCYLDRLREAVGFARKTSDLDPVIVVMLHPFDFVEYGRDKFLENDRYKGKYTYQSLEDLLSWLATQHDVATQTLGEAAKLAQDLGPGRLEAYNALEVSWGMAPGFLLAEPSVLFYPSTRLALRMRIAGWVRLILFYLLLIAVTAVLVGLAASVVFPRIKTGSLPRIAEYATASLLGLYVICVSTVALSRHAVRHRYLLVLAGLLGVCLGTWVAASARRRRILGR